MKADKDLNINESIKRLNNRINSFEDYFGAESEVAKHFKKLAYKPEGIKFKDGKIDPKNSTLEALHASLKIYPIMNKYRSAIRKDLKDKKGVTKPTDPDKVKLTKEQRKEQIKAQVMTEANARVKIANEFEDILDELYMYRDAGGDASALADKDYGDMLSLIHHKGEDW